MRLRVLVLVLAAAAAVETFALGADVAGTTNALVRGTCAGDVAVISEKSGSWRFEAFRETPAVPGRDVVTVRLSSPVEAPPPTFHVTFSVPGVRARNLWHPRYDRDGYHIRPWAWWDGTSFQSQLAYELPLTAAFDDNDRSVLAIACSEAFNRVDFGIFAYECTCVAGGRFTFFPQFAAPRRSYEVSVLIDRRQRFLGDTVKDASDWIAKKARCVEAPVPEAAFDPVYSSWYAYFQDVRAADLEKEARLAAALGMKTMILDDGWQKIESRTFYSATGDWMPVKSRFPDMKAHVDAVHRAGLRYMLWFAVPFVGNESKSWERFKDKLIWGKDGDTGALDPRFPEVREYLISTFERAVGEWGFDGLKLDFIDVFTLGREDPAEKEGYRGRDIKSMPEAVDRLMKDITTRLRKIKPDVLIEFRQHYTGPAIRQYGNMLRAADCPADARSNRRRIADLRLTSGGTAVHSDMLVWNRNETPQGAANQILNALFAVIQYSMILADLPPEHGRVIRHWLDFSQKHRTTLLKSAFRPHHAELGYTWIEAESDAERITAFYSPGQVVPVYAKKKEIVINATGADGAVLDCTVPLRAVIRDTFGEKVGETRLKAGLSRLAVPESGYAEITP